MRAVLTCPAPHCSAVLASSSWFLRPCSCVYVFLILPAAVSSCGLVAVCTFPEPAALPAILQLLWAEGGVKRFYKGFTPCLIRAAPANGAMLYTVDKVTYLLNKD